MKRLIILSICLMTLLTACSNNSSVLNESSDTSNSSNKVHTLNKPQFMDASVHDPSVIRVEDTFYVFGSHLAAAKTDDLMNWTQIASSVYEGNPLIPNALQEMRELFDWAETDTFWAADVIQLSDGKFYMYYNACKGDSPRSAMGVAVSDHIEGPYKDLGIILKSGMWGEPSEDGTIYDAIIHPNAVDPHVFFDKDNKLWLVYGSYSGGIFIMEMDPRTGFPLPDQGYGKKLLGENHSRIEGPYVLYSPETDYYYLFLSYGGLDASGGYNMRVARSSSPDGPYVDASGQDMIDAKGLPGTFFDDASIEPYGAKLMGNYQFNNVEGEIAGFGTGYVSPGHNSAYYDEDTDRYYVFFHTRFPARGEAHEVRVHQMLMNSEGWPVIMPHRYAGESTSAYAAEELIGEYKFINHGKDISADIKESVLIQLTEEGALTGEASGTWSMTGDYTADFIIDGVTYHGAFLSQWDTGTQSEVMTLAALSDEGITIWGSHVAK